MSDGWSDAETTKIESETRVDGYLKMFAWDDKEADVRVHTRCLRDRRCTHDAQREDV